MTRIFKFLTSSITAFSAAPRAARVGSFLFFVASVADGTLMPFFALWAHNDAGIPVEYIGLLLGCYAGGELLATPFVGGIADRVGRRPVLLASTTGVGLGFVLLFFARGADRHRGLATWLSAYSRAFCIPTAAAVIADVIPAEQRREHFAVTRIMSNAGGVVGPALGAVLALWSLHLVFFGAAAAILLGAVAVAAFLPETWRRSERPWRGDDDDEGLTALSAHFATEGSPGLLVSVAILEIVVSWIEAITPLYANAAGALTPTGIGLLFAYAGVLGVIFQLPVTQASQRMSGFATVVWSGAIQALAFAFLLPAPALPLLVARHHAPGFRAHAVGPPGAGDHVRTRPAQRAGDLSGRVLGGVRSQGRRRPGDRHLALRHVDHVALGHRHCRLASAASFALAFAARRHEAEQESKGERRLSAYSAARSSAFTSSSSSLTLVPSSRAMSS